MRPQHVLRFLLLNGLAVGLGATVATSCIAVNYPTVAFRCDPRQGDNCPDTHTCCSDDPSTADGSLPQFMGKTPISGASTPLYADLANTAGTSGMCVNTDSIPAGAGLAAADNCPIPCNPRWSAADVSSVCGPGRMCCQTVELGDKDCVQETDSGVWRPVTGADICTPTANNPCPIVPATNWNNVAHATHQDPNGTVCAAVSGGAGTAKFAECIKHLTVADQRGFCMSDKDDQGLPLVCPTKQPTYVDACTAKNGTPPPAGG